MTARHPRPIVSFGELLWDVFPDGARLGGAAANVAFHLAALGARVALISRVGRDVLGERAIAQLQAAGVGTDLVEVDNEHETGTVDVTFEGGEPHYSIRSRAAWDAIEVRAHSLETLGKARALCFGTLAQRTPLVRGSLHKAVAALPGDCLRVCDLNLRSPFFDLAIVEETLELSQIVKLNSQELDTLKSLCGQADSIAWLLDRANVSLVALTRGARGAALYTKKAWADHPGCAAASGGDAVGAGDAFTAVLTLELVKLTETDDGNPTELGHEQLSALALRANQYAAWVASMPGAMPTQNASAK